jgi:murein L,D-transpeptidase YcbB/YkuD
MPSFKRAALLAVVALSCALVPAGPDVYAEGPDPALETATYLREFLAAQGSPAFLEDDRDTQLWKALQAFYWNRGYAPAWVRGERLTPGGQALLRASGTAGREGLPAGRYDPRSITGHGPAVLQASTEAESANRLARLDVALTYVFLRYAVDLGTGVADPRGSTSLWRATPREIDPGALLAEAAERDAPAAVLDSVRPAHPQYVALAEALAKLRRIASAGGWPSLPATLRMKPGQPSPHAPLLRARLQASGDLAGAGIGKVHDKALVAALKRFERRHGLRADGIVDADTLAALNVPVEDRIRQVELNLERWRWLRWTPEGRAILVNVPTFELHAYEEGKEVLTMRVITGQGDSPTPIFAETMTHVVFSPHWNVPPNIAETEILPAVRRDRGYLSRNDMEFVRGESGEVQIRQRAGPRNSLGLVKFLFPNPYHIYLHDTPGDALFARDRRALSHGCVRLEKPEALARFVLRGSEWDDASIAAAMRSGNERFVALAEGVPLTIAYFTAWVDPDGSVRFAPDVYRHDVAQQALLPVPRPAALVASASS